MLLSMIHKLYCCLFCDCLYVTLKLTYATTNLYLDVLNDLSSICFSCTIIVPNQVPLCCTDLDLVTSDIQALTKSNTFVNDLPRVCPTEL